MKKNNFFWIVVSLIFILIVVVAITLNFLKEKIEGEIYALLIFSLMLVLIIFGIIVISIYWNKTKSQDKEKK